MGSHPPGRRDLSEEQAAAAEGGHECKRRRRTHEAPKSDPAALASSEDLDITQPDWWKPQPHATLDPSEYQDRPAAPLARALSCALCHDILKEAMTSLECGHTYCYDCIEGRVTIGGNHNVCPVAGCEVVLGPNPFDHHRLVYDTLMDALVQKIFPRPELDAALSARRADREEATRQARAAVNGSCGRTAKSHQSSEQGGAARRGGSGGGGGAGGGGRGVDSGEDGDAEGSDGDLRRPQSARCGPRRRQ